MAEKDMTEKALEAYNDVFADIVNNLIYNGEPVVKEDELEQGRERSVYAGEKALREQERDTSKYWRKHEIRIAYFGIENETVPEDDMPLRVMGYDGAAYRDQICYEKGEDGILRKTSVRYPVITLVLYFGYKKHWNKPLTLHEALGDSLDDKLKPFVSDFRINLFEIAYLTDEQLAGFKSDFWFVADYFVQMQRTGTYKGSEREMKHVREVLQLLAVLADDRRFSDAIDYITEHEKGKEIRTMSPVLDEIEHRGEVIKLIKQIIKKLILGKNEDLIAQELDEDPVRVNEICSIAKGFAPDYDPRKIYDSLNNKVLVEA